MQAITHIEPGQRLLINKQAQGQLGGLSAIFLLGMAVNLIGLPSQTTGSAKTVATILLVLHILIGLGLVGGGISTILKSRSSMFLKQARIGLIVIVLTFLCGVMDVNTKSNWWSYAMSVGFMAGLWVYGMLFIKTYTMNINPNQK
jgi:hypothetical protein